MEVAACHPQPDRIDPRTPEHITSTPGQNGRMLSETSLASRHSCPPLISYSPLLRADGSVLITERANILDRWAEHLGSILNHPSFISNDAVAHLPQVEINDALDIPPSISNVEKAIKRVSCGEAQGPDAVPAEIYKAGGPSMTKKFYDLFVFFWGKRFYCHKNSKMPSLFTCRNAKGNKQCCDNQRNISPQHHWKDPHQAASRSSHFKPGRWSSNRKLMWFMCWSWNN